MIITTKHLKNKNMITNLELKLEQLLKKQNNLYLKGSNDEKLNHQIRSIQKQIREQNKS